MLLDYNYIDNYNYIKIKKQRLIHNLYILF